jgi:hypothetical protein
MQMEQTATRPGVRERQTAAKLDPEAFGLACGLLWGVGLFSLTWWIIALDGPSDKPTGLSKLYRGYTISPTGSIIGLVWGFFDALCGGLSLAWLYNWLVHYRRS